MKRKPGCICTQLEKFSTLPHHLSCKSFLTTISANVALLNIICNLQMNSTFIYLESNFESYLLIGVNVQPSKMASDQFLYVPLRNSTSAKSRLLLPRRVWRIFGLKMFSTVFLWIKNFEKNLNKLSQYFYIYTMFYFTILPISISIESQQLLWNTNKVAHVC